MKTKLWGGLCFSVNTVVMTKRIELPNRMVELYKSPEHWTKDKVYIYDPKLQVTKAEKAKIIDYLYSEGFIEDRRTPSELVRIEY